MGDKTDDENDPDIQDKEKENSISTKNDHAETTLSPSVSQQYIETNYHLSEATAVAGGGNSTNDWSLLDMPALYSWKPSIKAQQLQPVDETTNSQSNFQSNKNSFLAAT